MSENIKAEILCDSINEQGNRLTTFKVRFHRFILSEINTHRSFSRNFRSSRAVPVKRLIAEVRINPATPVVWRTNQPGMVGGAELGPHDLCLAQDWWRIAARTATEMAERLLKVNAEKAVINRILEPFLYVHGVITATEWGNFFKLRTAYDAQPELRDLAVKMQEAMRNNVPRTLERGYWHLPYITIEDWDNVSTGVETLASISAARCARVSYVGHDGKPTTHEQDIALFEKLFASGHFSVCEHQAKVPFYNREELTGLDMQRNFRGFHQYRALIGG